MSHRKMTPKGQMSSSGSGPAIMMMPPHIRATFMPNPPLRYLPTPKKGGRCKRRSVFGGNAHLILDDDKKEGKIIKKEQEEEEEEELFGHSNNHHHQGQNKNKHSNNNEQKQYVKNSSLTGVASLMIQFERTPAPKRKVGMTPKIAIVQKNKKKKQENTDKLKPLIDLQLEQIKEAKGEFEGMNCYNTLFVGRLAYETTERKLLREFEVFGPVNNLKLVTVKKDDNQSNTSSETGKSRGYAFVEFEREEDMKRAYRGADGMKLDGRAIVVDVERGHTVPNWLPRRLGGGLGGTRLGGKDKNITAPGRFDPSKATQAQAQANQMMMNNHHNMMGGPPPNYPHPMGMQHGGGGYGQRPPYGGGHQGGPPPPHHYHGGGGPRGGGGGGPTNEYYGRGPPNNNDRYGGGGGPAYSSYGRGGPPPPPSSYHNHRGGGRYGNGGSDRYGDRNDRYGSSNSRGPPPPSSSSGRSSSYNGMGGGGDSNRRRRSRSRSPSSSRDSKRRYRG